MFHSTTFSPEIIPQINKVLKFVLENPYSDFYRNKYKSLGIKEIKSYEDFQRIPFLTKDEILAVPMHKRTFVPKDKIAYYSFSSGTTNNKIPTIIPNIFSSNDNFGEYNFFNINKVKALKNTISLMLLPPLSLNVIIRGVFSEPLNNITVISGDTNNLDLTAKILKELAIETIVTIPTILDRFIISLEKIAFNPKQIKLVFLRGEFCSVQRLEYFKSIMPNAVFYFHYGGAESGSRAYKCDYIIQDTAPNILHPVPFILFEIASEKDIIVPWGESSELFCTDLKINKAFPLIRYKTGDIGSLKRQQCPCGNKYILAIGGRKEYDVLKFSGITLYAELIAQTVEGIKEFIEPNFQMHVFEKKINDKLKPKLQLRLKLKKESENLKNDPYFKKQLAIKISDKLRLSAKSTLKQLVDQEIFLPLEIIFVESWSDDQIKSKNIISHLN